MRVSLQHIQYLAYVLPSTTTKLINFVNRCYIFRSFVPPSDIKIHNFKTTIKRACKYFKFVRYHPTSYLKFYVALEWDILNISRICPWLHDYMSLLLFFKAVKILNYFEHLVAWCTYKQSLSSLKIDWWFLYFFLFYLIYLLNYVCQRS